MCWKMEKSETWCQPEAELVSYKEERLLHGAGDLSDHLVGDTREDRQG